MKLNEVLIKEKINSEDILSKLKALEKNNIEKEKTKGFVLEDEYGNLIKIYVSADQADEFENAIGKRLSEIEEDYEKELDVFELLFDLRKEFNIVDVYVESIPEDEEDELEIDANGDNNDLESEDGNGDMVDNVNDDLSGGLNAQQAPTAYMNDSLSKIIDMLKADASAKEAEARAKEAEAKAREAEANRDIAELKIKREEELLDMEDFNKRKSEEDKEANQLKQLAKFRREKNRTDSDFV